MSVLTGAIGVAGGVLLGRTALRRERKILGVPVPSKVDVDTSGLTHTIAEAGRQFGKLASEVRTVREKAEQIGKVIG
jgi:hypothetical protein